MQVLCGGINFLMTLQGHVLFLEQFINIFCVGDYSIFFFVSKLYSVYVCCIYSLCCIWYYVHVFVFVICISCLCIYVCTSYVYKI